MTHKLFHNLLIIFFFILSNFSCIWVRAAFSHRYFQKYSLKEKPDESNGYITWLDVNDTILFNKSNFLKNAYLADSFFVRTFDSSTTLVTSTANYRNLLNEFSNGEETYIVSYRTFIDMCCDAYGEMTYYALFNILNKDINLKKSIISVSGGQIPNKIWYLKKGKITNGKIYAEIIEDDTLSNNKLEEIIINFQNDTTESLQEYHKRIEEYKNIVRKYYRWDKK